MTQYDDKQPDRSLTSEEEAQAHLLTAADLKRIDECLLSYTSEKWRKVAYVVGRTITDLYHEFPAIPDGFYSARIKHLVASGAIEAAGNLDRMRYSEIRLRDKNPF